MRGILREPEVVKLTTLSRSAIRRKEQKGKFPRRKKLGGGRAVGWLASEVEEWIKSLPDARDEGDADGSRDDERPDARGEGEG